MWGGSGRRTRPHRRLVPQSAAPHLWRLSISGDSLYHVMRWNVEIVDNRCLGDMRLPDGRIRRYGVESSLGDDNRGRGKGQVPNVDIDRGRGGHDHSLGPPGSVGIVDFGW